MVAPRGALFCIANREKAGPVETALLVPSCDLPRSDRARLRTSTEIGPFRFWVLGDYGTCASVGKATKNVGIPHRPNNLPIPSTQPYLGCKRSLRVAMSVSDL